MRWKSSIQIDGTDRIVSKFLWFPVRAIFQGEVRWLEFVKMKQSIGATSGRWITTEFIDPPKTGFSVTYKIDSKPDVLE